MFFHAWDVADGGADKVMSWMGECGLNTMCLAATYHSGWFLHPHAERHRAYMTEGSVCYFRPQYQLWKGQRLQPKLASLCAETDWFGEVERRLDKHGLRLVAWTVGTHNSRFGRKHPEFTQRNVYGDRLPYALCPSNPEVRTYLKTLCRDLVANHPLSGIQLEAFAWMSFAHGHHHERDLVGLTPFEQDLMSLCFCPVCSDAASKANVDVGAVRETVKEVLDGVFREAPDRPRNHPPSMKELECRCVELRNFNLWRKNCLTSLIAEIKTESLVGTNCRLLLQTGFDAELADVADGFACFAFQKTPVETRAICRNEQQLTAGWSGLVQCCVQLGCGVPKNERQLREIIAAIQRTGCNGVNFYNHSEAPPKMLGWLNKVLPSFAET